MSICLHYNYREIDSTKVSEECDFDSDSVCEVYLKECKLFDVPFWIYNLRNLTILKLASNKIQKIDDEISMLIHLEMLDVSENKLTSINRNLFKIKCLKCLDFSGNKIEDLPPDIENLSNLEVLLFDRNKIHQIPVNLTKLEKVFQLSFEYCSNLSVVPGNLLNMKNVRFISLRGCNLSVLPSIISPKIEFLLLTENRLVNNIPLSLAQHILGLQPSNFYKINEEQLEHFRLVQTETIKYTGHINYITLDNKSIANIPKAFSKVLNKNSKDVISLQELCLRQCKKLEILEHLPQQLPKILRVQLRIPTTACVCGNLMFQEGFVSIFYQKDTILTGLLLNQYFCSKGCQSKFLESYKDVIDVLY